jgi:radical SAM protein with 4Fe4S-binding SPASM domain
MTEPPRRLNVMDPNLFPAYVVWELTLRCDQRCTHCGSRAEDARPDELTREEAMRVVRQLADMKTQEVVLIGGEAYLHDAFIDVIAALKQAGIRPTMTSGGRGITADMARAMKAAGLHSVSLSVDGLGRTHDQMRATPGGFDATVASFGHLREAGLRLAANTNFNRFNQGDLEGLYEHFRKLGVQSWQVQITAPLGRAADRPDMLLQPYDLLTLVPRIAALKERGLEEGLLIMPGNNLGYFGPSEGLLRSQRKGDNDHWAGCVAGRFAMGIESNGDVKGCPSLQTSHYVGGNLRQASVRELWDRPGVMHFARGRTVDDLWGFCRSCAYAETCLAGCSFTSHAVLGRPGNNPYCHYRARTLASRGVRERLVRVKKAPGQPFDCGLFDIVEEPLDTPESTPEKPEHRLRVV